MLHYSNFQQRITGTDTQKRQRLTDLWTEKRLLQRQKPTIFNIFVAGISYKKINKIKKKIWIRTRAALCTGPVLVSSEWAPLTHLTTTLCYKKGKKRKEGSTGWHGK